MACLPIALWYVFRGDWKRQISCQLKANSNPFLLRRGTIQHLECFTKSEHTRNHKHDKSCKVLSQQKLFGAHTWLWSGKGMMEAQTPRIMAGWISQCVYVEQYPMPFSCRSSGVIANMIVSSSIVSMYSTTPLATKSCQLQSVFRHYQLGLVVTDRFKYFSLKHEMSNWWWLTDSNTFHWSMRCQTAICNRCEWSRPWCGLNTSEWLDLRGQHLVRLLEFAGLKVYLCFKKRGCFLLSLPVIVVFSLFQIIDVSFLQEQLLVLDNQKRPANTTRVGVNANFPISDVSHLNQAKHKQMQRDAHQPWN